MNTSERKLLTEVLYRHVAYDVKVERRRLKYPKTIDAYVTLKPDDIRSMEIGTYDIVPYLYPVSSLTESQCDELFSLVLGSEEEAGKYGDWIKFRKDGDIEFIFTRRSYKDVWKLYEWLYRNHFDVDGLIGMGLARDATGTDAYRERTCQFCKHCGDRRDGRNSIHYFCEITKKGVNIFNDCKVDGFEPVD